MTTVTLQFSKIPVLKMFFEFLRFEERFRRASFSWRISVDGRPNRRNKAVFSNFYGVVWTENIKRIFIVKAGTLSS